MKKRSLSAVACVAALALSLAACSDGGSSASGGGPKDVEDVTIGFAQQTLLAPYYVAMEKEAKRLSSEKGFKLIFQQADGDPVTQVDQVQTMVSQGADVIIINAISADTEKSQVEAISKQTPVMFIDTPIPGIGFTTVQSDNVTIGKGAGELMAKRIGSGKTIQLAMLTGRPTDVDVGPERRKGFLAGLEAGGVKYDIVAEQAANYTQEEAVSATEDMLAAHPDIDVIFGYNDSMALGAMQTLRSKGNANVLVAGIDGQKEALAEIAKGCDSQYVATGLNSPVLAARDAIDAALAVGTGEKDPDDFEKVSFTKAVGVGCDNVDEFYDPDSVF
jgi:ABC-type sugar transport system substrate-binding protein